MELISLGVAVLFAICKNFLTVPDIKSVDVVNFEKPVFSSGRLSRISMIPEVEAENYSDDDIGVDVPTGSINSSQLSEEPSGSSLSKTGSIYSSTDTFNSLSMEENIINDIDDTNGLSDNSEYLADGIKIRSQTDNINTGLDKKESTELAKEIERHGIDNNMNNPAEINDLCDSSRHLTEEIQSGNTIGSENIDTNTNTYDVIDNIDPVSEKADTDLTDINTHIALQIQTDMESQREFLSEQKVNMRSEIETDSDIISPQTRNTSTLPGDSTTQEEELYNPSNGVTESGSKISNQQGSQTHSDAESLAIDAYSENSLLYISSSAYSDESELGNESYSGCSNSKLSIDSRKTKFEYKSDSSLSGENHWEEISVDDEVVMTLTEHSADSDTEITIDVVKEGEDNEIENKYLDDEVEHSSDSNHECSKSGHALPQFGENEDNVITGTKSDENDKGGYIERNHPEIVTDMKTNEESAHIQDNVCATETDISVHSYTTKYVNGDIIRSKSLNVISSRENDVDVAGKYSKSWPCLSDIDIKPALNVGISSCLEDGEDGGDNSKKGNINPSSNGDQENDRGISVSNVILDSQIVSLTPTTVTSKDVKIEIQDTRYVDELPAIRTQTEIKSHGNIVHAPTSHGFNQDNKENDDIANDLPAITAKEILETNREEDRSPSDKTEYDYKQRRGSYRKIKMEGRRRQRLSISEGVQSTSPVEMTEEDDELGHIFHNRVNTVRPTSAPILHKRQKMMKISLKSKTGDPETVSITSKTSARTTMCIPESDTVINHEQNKKRHKLQVLQAGSPTFSKSLDSSTRSKVNNINSLNTEIIAIYNASSPEPIVAAENNRSKRKHKSKRKQKMNDAYFEGYDLLRNCNQSHCTESFVTDINQLIVKTRTQTPDAGISQRDLKIDGVSNNTNIDNKDNTKNKYETKSHLLPDYNETGNCQIKPSQKCAIENYSLSHNCDRKQLSLRRNGYKNNEINEPKYVIEENKQSKVLCKRETYEDLYKGKVLSGPFMRTTLHANFAGSLASQTDASLISLKSELLPVDTQVKRTNEYKDLTETTYSDDSYHSQDEQAKHSEMTTRKETSRVGNSENSSQNQKSLDECEEMSEYTDRELSARLQRTQSALTDTARLKSIRKLLRLPSNSEDNEHNHKSDNDSQLIIQDILDDLIITACKRGNKKRRHTATRTHRCTTVDDDGEEVLCCLLQTSSNKVDPSCVTCDVIDALDVYPVTRKHEHLISNIVRISSTETARENSMGEIMANIPIAHWYVEPWQELVIRQQDHSGHWQDTSETMAEIVKIDDAGKVFYGVRHFLSEPCTLAVVSRPRVTSVSLAKHNVTVNAVTDDRVKMHLFSSEENKTICMQVIPVEQRVLAEFQDKVEHRKCGIVVAASPLVLISVQDNVPESMAFDVPYVLSYPRRPEVRSPVIRNTSPYMRPSDQLSRDECSRAPLLAPYISPAQTSRHLSVAEPLTKADDQLAFHLVHVDDDDDVRVKLLGNSGKKIDVVKNQIDKSYENEDQSVRFSVYDKTARLIAMETRGSREYTDVQKVTRLFVNYLVKHKVTLRMSQDPRNVYSIFFSAIVHHPHREENYHMKQTYKHFTNTVKKEIQMYEGEVVAIVFRGNVEVPEKQKLIFSYQGYKGIRRHFDIQVSNPMSQRSLQTYHGALQIFTYNSPRVSAIDRSLAPCSKNGWDLCAEFPLLLPKYPKTTPVIINKAPVSLKFREPLTVDFIRTLSSDLLTDWAEFATALGISHARVQAIKQQHRNQVSDKVLMDVIINWMKTQTISQDKAIPMINALRACNRWKLASELAYRYSAQKVTRSKTARDKSLQRAFSIITKSTAVTARWRQLLHLLCHVDGSHVVDITKQIDEKYNDEVSRCQSALCHWRTTTTAPSVWKLVDALRISRCNIVADTIVALESKRT